MKKQNNIDYGKITKIRNINVKDILEKNLIILILFVSIILGLLTKSLIIYFLMFILLTIVIMVLLCIFVSNSNTYKEAFKENRSFKTYRSLYYKKLYYKEHPSLYYFVGFELEEIIEKYINRIVITDNYDIIPLRKGQEYNNHYKKIIYDENEMKHFICSLNDDLFYKFVYKLKDSNIYSIYKGDMESMQRKINQCCIDNILS
ncbi:hypothetical protein [Anaerofustis butyriciformans]|uniref:hypothetical protein n=1 Tax=Anaerofustis butyriciformans TaxID=3108533 RepID=UPI002E2EF9A2|nr:hypothetical protein [Anaerofustis sp. HA2171]